MHPFLDVSKLTNEEIIDKLGKAYTFMNAQSSLGHDATVHSILEVIQSLEDERQSRSARNADEEFKKKFPNFNKPIELGKLEE